MPRRKKPAGGLVPSNQRRRNTIRRTNGGGEPALVDATYLVPSINPISDEPWALEEDKISWTDEMSGLGCIIRRSGVTCCLEGYAGVGPYHPLFGATPGALVGVGVGVGVGIRAHGGIDHCKPCEGSGDKSASFPHLVSVSHKLHSQMPVGDQNDTHDDAWWFGFSCDKASDDFPGTAGRCRDKDLPTVTNERTYRDESFAHRECVQVAAQLTAIADGCESSDIVPGRARLPILHPARVED